MKIKILKDKSYKFRLHLAKGEVRDAIWSEDANAYQVKSSENVILNVSKKDAKVILSIDELENNGKMNMFRAGQYLSDTFGIDRKEANEILTYWMSNYEEIAKELDIDI
jgi:hypothetical protein